MYRLRVMRKGHPIAGAAIRTSRREKRTRGHPSPGTTSSKSTPTAIGGLIEVQAVQLTATKWLAIVRNPEESKQSAVKNVDFADGGCDRGRKDGAGKWAPAGWIVQR